MLALGSVLGRKVCIRPKRLDSWYEAPNLWGAIVGRPGVLKSPALNEALRPLRELEGAAAKTHAAALLEWQASNAASEIRRTAAKQNAVRSAKKGHAFDTSGLIEGDGDEPAMRRYVVNDTSVESLGEILIANPNGVLAYRDELIGLLRLLDKEGNEGMRSFYLTAWNAKEPYTFDRIGRGLNRRIDASCLSLLGSIQPGVIGEYLREAVANFGGDGLMSRFSLLTWPDVSGEWRNIDRWPNSTARETAFGTFRRFDTLTPELVGAVDEFGDVHTLRFAPDAQDFFNDWRERFERTQRCGDANGMHSALIIHREKYRKLVPALALIYHLADKPNGGPVGIDALRRALGWARYGESHAQRAYASVIRADADSARELLKRIRRGDVVDGFRVRDIYVKGWAHLGKSEPVKQAVALLCEFDYLREQEEKTGGRWTSSYRIHPSLLAEANQRIGKVAGMEPTEPTEEASDGFDGSRLGTLCNFSPSPLPDQPNREVF
jgi:putative DNA primase/helicase